MSDTAATTGPLPEPSTESCDLQAVANLVEPWISFCLDRICHDSGSSCLEKRTEQLTTNLAAVVSSPTKLQDALRSLWSHPLIASGNRLRWSTEQTRLLSGVQLNLDCDSSIIRLSDSTENRICLAVAGATFPARDTAAHTNQLISETARRLACCGSVPIGLCAGLVSGQSDSHLQEKFVADLQALCETAKVHLVSRILHCDSLPEMDLVGMVIVLFGSPGCNLHLPPRAFQAEGDAIILLGDGVDLTDPSQSLAGSLYGRHILGLETGSLPVGTLERERELHLALRALVYTGEIKSAHACSAGGLAMALLESCLGAPGSVPMGVRVELDPLLNPQASPTDVPAPNPDSSSAFRCEAFLFGELPGRVLLSVSAINCVKILARARLLGIPGVRLGTVGGGALEIRAQGQEMNWRIQDFVVEPAGDKKVE